MTQSKSQDETELTREQKIKNGLVLNDRATMLLAVELRSEHDFTCREVADLGVVDRSKSWVAEKTKAVERMKEESPDGEE